MGSNVKKARVSWPSDSMLCQVKMFQTEDYPAKVGAQTCSKSKASKDLHRGTVYSTRPPNIPLITWKLPPKFILSDHLLVASGEESTETGSENLRIAKVLEAFYPHRSLIPSRPSISPAVQVDDSITPTIRLTPIEDDDDHQPETPAIQFSQSSKTPPSLFGLGPADLTPAALSALLNTKEQGSMVDADLLVKFLTDPIIINNLLDAAAAKPLETGNNTTIKPPPQHVTTSSANSPPGNGVTPVSAAAQSIFSDVPTQRLAPLVLNTCPLSCALKPLLRVEESLEPSSVVVSEPQCQSPTSGTWNMSRVLESAVTGTDAQSAYPMNVTRDDYFKHLIREHGGVVAPATNNYSRRVDHNNNNNDKKKTLVKVKAQKPCMFLEGAKGVSLGRVAYTFTTPPKGCRLMMLLLLHPELRDSSSELRPSSYW